MPFRRYLTPPKPYLVNQNWENLGLYLPRSILNWAEIHAAPKLASDSEITSSLSFWRSRKVALVKQSTYPGVYLPGKGRNWINTVLTAPSHLGPMSFLANLNADYFVIRQTSEPETYLWKEKFMYDADPQAAFRGVEICQKKQEAMEVVDCDQIRWDDYDLVVCLDIPIPSNITLKSKKPIWAYYSVEAGGPLHKRSLVEPVKGYHLYFNHCFRRYRARPKNRSHALEFPFTFQSADTWQSLAQNTHPSKVERHGAVVDRASWETSLGDKPSYMTPLSGDASTYIRMMTSRQFAIWTNPKPRWGNWALEAVQAGCLFLGRADSLAMSGVLLPDLVVSDLASAHRKIESLLRNPLHMQSLAKTQAALAEHLAFRRPLMDLTAYAKKFFAK
jgi:hypothetical protein